MGLLELLMPGSDAANWANQNTNWLGSVGAGLASKGNFADKLSNVAAYQPAGRAADATAQETLNARNQTAAWFHQKGRDDLAQLVTSGNAPQAFAMYQADMSKGPEGPIKVGKDDVLLDPKTYQPLYQPTQGPDLKEQFGNEKDLYAQYSNADPVKTYSAVRDAYERVRQSGSLNTGAGDMGLIYGYMKMLDPGSVVRESEFAMAAQAGSYGEQIQGLVQRVLTGERLPESVRQQFVQAAEKLYAESAGNLGAINSQFTQRANTYGVDPTSFIRQPETYAPLADLYSKYGLEQ